MSEDEFVGRVRARAANVTTEMMSVVKITMDSLTPNQRQDVLFLARQTYFQGRMDGVADLRRESDPPKYEANACRA